jgi:hypothetical protein
MVIGQPTPCPDETFGWLLADEVDWASSRVLLVSVAGAFTASEWRHMLGEASIPAENTEIESLFPFRYDIACRKA